MNRILIISGLLLTLLSSCASAKLTKINGVSFVAAPDSVDVSHIGPVKKMNANYAAVMPFGFVRNLEHPELIFNTDRQWFGESVEGSTQYIRQLHKNGISVLLKPQIWVWRGEFTGHLTMKSEEDWTLFEQSYEKFILTFAELAEKEQVEVFCVGTELEQFIVHRPDYWKQLITRVGSVYSGKLTYAANWDEYKRVPFWDLLDYIGIDAYFPIAESETPTVEEATQAWNKWKPELSSFSEQLELPILFTEYGYRSVDYAGREPWKSDREMQNVNLEAQANLLKALYDTVWPESWFAGGFIWKWHINHPESGGSQDSQFTPQNKPAEKLIISNYSHY